MNRFDEIKDLLIRASEATSMFYHVRSYGDNDVEQFWPSMKLYTKSGVLFFTDNTRTLQFPCFLVVIISPT